MTELIRVFISYSHKDLSLVKKMAKVLQKAGMIPIWTEKLVAGTGFDEQIKDFIQHAHIFVPVLTESSSGWVHQEIGYALALNIPVFPVTTDDINPGGMLQMIQAVKISDDESVLSEKLTHKVFMRLLDNINPNALYQRAGMVEERASLMKQYADKLIKMSEFGLVRQRGGLSSFHIPADPIHNPKWNKRYFPEKRSDYHKKVQREERIALSNHATVSGCRLIISPSYAIEGRSKIAIVARLEEMIRFLRSMPDDKVVIIGIQQKQTFMESLTIVGDLFLAESVSFKNGDGFTNTFFTRNASEIQKRIEEFDNELDLLLDEAGWAPHKSKYKAIDELERILKSTQA